jgi:hypothetical protein
MDTEKGQRQIQGNSGLKCGPLQNPIFSVASAVAEQLHTCKGGILTEMVEGKRGKYQRSKYKFPMPEVPPVMITVSPDNLKAVKGRVSQSAKTICKQFL